MKNIILLFMLGGCTAANAQNGIYLAPSLGIGQTNVKSNIVNAPISIRHYGGKLGIGYPKNKWRLESGLRYFTTGYKTRTYYLFDNNMYFPTIWNQPDLFDILTYRHLEVPLKIGYEVKLAHRLFFVPMIGISTSYNMGARDQVESSGRITQDGELTASEFDSRYQRYSAWVNLALNLEYKVSKRTNVVAAFQGDYMFTSLLKPHVYYNQSTQNNYAYSFNLGVKWNIRSQRNYLN